MNNILFIIYFLEFTFLQQMKTCITYYQHLFELDRLCNYLLISYLE